MITVTEANQRAREKFVGFPPEIADDYVSFVEGRDPNLLRRVVLGVLQFYLAKPPAKPLMELSGSTRLLEDLGCDSLTMVDTLFMAESLFDIRLADDELSRVTTLDDLVEHFRQHVLSL
jgi:acyl carrier protein